MLKFLQFGIKLIDFHRIIRIQKQRLEQTDRLELLFIYFYTRLYNRIAWTAESLILHSQEVIEFIFSHHPVFSMITRVGILGFFHNCEWLSCFSIKCKRCMLNLVSPSVVPDFISQLLTREKLDHLCDISECFLLCLFLFTNEWVLFES